MGRLLKFWFLSRHEKKFFFEAGALLLLCNLCIRTIPFRYIDRFLWALCDNSVATALHDADNINLVRLSLSRAANLLPWKSLCLSRSIAAFIMLRRRDIPAVIVAGAKFFGDSSLLAHAWIQIDSKATERYSERSEFIPLVRIGQQPLITESSCGLIA
jgi:hypothetical protein